MESNQYQNYTKDQLLILIKKLERQRYGIFWEDKVEENAEKCKHEIPTLFEDKGRELFISPLQPTHLIIEGDNYHSLINLNFTHEKKIDLIYIDPPYNTGKENEWRYNDKWVDKNDRFRHSKWLSFMNKRLRLAKRLLKDTGIIFISIDDNEVANLKLLCDKIFSERNFLNILVWDLGTGTQAGHFVRSHEYILAYAKQKDSLSNFTGEDGIIDHSALKRISKKNPASDFFFPKGTKFEAPDGYELADSWGDSEKTYLIEGKFIAEDNKLKEDVILRAGWAQKTQMKNWFDGEVTYDTKGQKVIEFYFNKNGVLRYKKEKSITNPPTVLRTFGSTKNGSTDLENILGEQGTFNYPKPVLLLKFLIGLKPKNSVILDFFAGSGTVGQAVLELNDEDNGNRQFILCTNNENKICEEITYPRIINVVNRIVNKKGKAANLKYYKNGFFPNILTDNDKRRLLMQSTELICVAENTYSLVSQVLEGYAIFTNESQVTAIIYDEDLIEQCCRKLNNLDAEATIVIYVFSYDQTVDDEQFTSLTKNYRIKPVPEFILSVFRRLLKVSN